MRKEEALLIWRRDINDDMFYAKRRTAVSQAALLVRTKALG